MKNKKIVPFHTHNLFVIGSICLFLLVVSSLSIAVAANSSGASSWGNTSPAPAQSNFKSSFINTPGPVTSFKVFSAGNVGTTIQGSNNFIESIGGTASYRNANGTYGTITVPTWSSGSDSCSGGSLVSSCGSSSPTPSCPANTQYNAQTGYCEPVTCTTTGSGKGAQTTCVPTPNAPPACPEGLSYSSTNGCVPTQICTTSGKGASTSCVQNPLLSQPLQSCTLDGITIPSGQSRVFFSQETVPYGQTCASVAAARLCTNGTLSGSSVYNRANCTVGNAPTLGTISIDATPSIIRYDGSSRISWDGGNAEACAVVGTNFTGSGVKSSKLATTVKEETTYTLTCVLGPYQKSVSTTVRIVPVWQEI